MKTKQLVLLTLACGSALLLVGLSSCETSPPPRPAPASPFYEQGSGPRAPSAQGSGYQGSGY